MKREEIIAVVGCVVFGGIIGGYVSKFLVSHEVLKDISNEKEKLENTLAKADEKIKNIDEQVDSAVRFVYDSEAKNAFDKRLRAVNIETVAESVCKAEIRKIEDSVIRRQIKSEYESQIHRVMQDEIKEYFKTGIKQMIDVDIDSEFVRRTAKQYIKDSIEDIVETEVKRAVDKCDIDKNVEDAIEDLDMEDVVEDYFNSHTRKVQGILQSAVEKVLRDKLNDAVIEKVADTISEEFD